MTQQNEIPEGCLAFDLDKALSGWPCIVDNTGIGRNAVFYDEHTKNILCVFKGKDRYHSEWIPKENIFLKKKTRTYYQNIYRHSAGHLVTGELSTDDNSDEPGNFEDLTLAKKISFELDDIDIDEKPKTKTLWVAIEKKNPNYAIAYTFQQKFNLEDKLKQVSFPELYNLVQVEVPCE